MIAIRGYKEMDRTTHQVNVMRISACGRKAGVLLSVIHVSTLHPSTAIPNTAIKIPNASFFFFFFPASSFHNLAQLYRHESYRPVPLVQCQAQREEER
jgi:hypothetical protein